MLSYLKVTLSFLLIVRSIGMIGQNTAVLVLPDSNIVFRTEKIEGVIFGKNFTLRRSLIIRDTVQVFEIDPLKIYAKEDSGRKRFVPTVQMVISIEPILKDFIQDSSKFISDNLFSYVKQYFGYITSDGDTVVLINGFFDERTKQEGDWTSRMIKVFDG